MMAEEIADLPLTPEATKSCEIDVRRHSVGKANSGDSKAEVLSRYLRASTGSCHDMCKYGKKHKFQVNERRSITKRVTRRPPGQSSEESVVGINKTAAVEFRVSLDSKSQISDTSRHKMPTKSPASPKVVNQVLVTRKKTSTDESVMGRKKTPEVKATEILDSKPQISDTPDTNEKQMPAKSSDNIKQVQNEVLEDRKKTSPLNHPKSQTSDLTRRMRQAISTAKKVEASSKDSKPTLSKAKEMKLSAKHVIPSNPKILVTTSSVGLSEGSVGQRNSELKIGKRSSLSKVTVKKFLTTSRALLSPKPSHNGVASIGARKHKNLKFVSHLKNESITGEDEPEQYRNNEVEEKTLYVIEVESEKQNSQSDQNASPDVESSLPPSLLSPKFSSSILPSSSQEDQEKSEYTTSEAEEDSILGDYEIEHLESGKALEVEEKSKPGNDQIICSEEKDCQISKLKFRRGKVINVQSEKNTPRRLKFRRGKVSGENADAKNQGERKSFKRTGRTDGDSIGSTPDPEIVILRHQDVQDKKDSQGLLNNVIEETACKLAETRKSKVKVLVGAFETVISLQEKKRSASPAS